MQALRRDRRVLPGRQPVDEQGAVRACRAAEGVLVSVQAMGVAAMSALRQAAVVQAIQRGFLQRRMLYEVAAVLMG